MRMRGARAVSISGALFAASILWLSVGCSGSGTVHSPTLEGNFLQYQKADLISMNLSGRAVCGGCDNSARFNGLLVELSVKDDPTKTLAINTFDGLGQFSISGVQAPKGMALLVSGTLYLEGGPDAGSLETSAEVTAPDGDGDTVAVVLDFSPRS
ncbi:MAG: hypothetical protein WC956_11250 [bacterium]